MRVLGIALALLLPMQVQALSCAEPSAARAFQAAAASDEAYIVVSGRLTHKIPRKQKSRDGVLNGTGEMRVPARLRGTSLSAAGFKRPFDQKVTLEIICFGPWCGTAQNGEQVLAFLKRQEGEYVLEIDPCSGQVFRNPDPRMLKRVERCFTGRTCKD